VRCPYPHAIYEESLHPQKLGVSISFHTTANTDVYLDIYQEFFNQLYNREMTLGDFQQNAES
jgi:hypothetical protein